MEILKNKQSRKHFIKVSDVDKKSFLGVTPMGEIKPLEYHLFEEPTDIDDDSLFLDDYVSQIQIDKYAEYNEKQKNAAVERILYIYDNMTEYQQKRFNILIGLSKDA